MTNFLGKGLGSLIPEKDRAPEGRAAMDLLAHQDALAEPTYRFYEEPEIATSRVREKSVDSESPEPSKTSEPPAARKEVSIMSATPRAAGARPAASVFWIEVSKISPNPFQPREHISVESLTPLAESIRTHGILQPLVVSKKEEETSRGLDVRYELIAGERRLEAAKLAGLRQVPVIIREAELQSRDKLELALIENVQREDLNPIERARAFARLVDEFGLLQREVAARIGKSREYVGNVLRLLSLPEEMQLAISQGKLTEGHGRVLLMVDNLEKQQTLFNQMSGSSISVRDAERVARAVSGRPRRMRRGRLAAPDPELRQLQKTLEEAFGTRVEVVKQGEGGKIVVEFYSPEELQNILNRLGAPREDGYV